MHTCTYDTCKVVYPYMCVYLYVGVIPG